ncbi:DENN (AEX-3) domain containing protein [Acanthamoeba castellanii str. Neff]|uniref:DENN (AEX-3) domain containing protein n=1 Tax=Acanthamoeba castellanii (strain ATCC 30010 / Neff) TaxID=1257118 RepID=L8GVR5_ACACF|nr:DENN (AEX-3) domain containing protein [Acanthamoeba castellanii str. Neff]ELR16156.1 DENN (AEX-3) domain containing protein [Acanthamoeba castellanii str. Neff]
MATPATQPRVLPQAPLPRLPTTAAAAGVDARGFSGVSSSSRGATQPAPAPAAASAPAKGARPMLDLAILCVAPSSSPAPSGPSSSSATALSSVLWRLPSDATDFTFTLTDAEGQRQYGFCRRFTPPLLPRSPGVEEAAKAGAHTACLCLLSHHGWFGPMEQVLDALYRTLALERHPALPQAPTMDDLLSHAGAFVSALLASPLPAPGEPFADYKASCSELLVPPPSERLELLRPMDNEGTLPITHGMMKSLFSSLLVLRVLLLFTALLSERRIIFHSHSIQKLSHATHAASSLLYPFSWQHIFVPVLPRGLINYCEAPMPFIVGLLSSQLPLVKKMHLESVVFVDLDGNSINANIEDAAILPREHVTLLKQTIEDALYTDNRSEQVRFKVVQHAFREFFLSMLAGYRRYMVPSMDQPRSEPEFRFDRGAFIRNHPKKSVRKFLSVFCHSQMFTQFISEREAWASRGQQPQGLFEREVQAYQDLGAQSGLGGGVSGGAGGAGGGGGNKKEKLRTFLSQKSEEAKAKLADLREEGEKRLEKMREEKRGGARYDRYDHHDQAPTVAIGAPSFVSHTSGLPRGTTAATRGPAPGAALTSGGGVPGRPHGVGRAPAALPNPTAKPPPLPARPAGGVQSARDFWENKGGPEQQQEPMTAAERRKTLPPLPNRNALSNSGAASRTPAAGASAPEPTPAPMTSTAHATRGTPTPTTHATRGAPTPTSVLAPSPTPAALPPIARARIVRHDHPPFELRVPFDLPQQPPAAMAWEARFEDSRLQAPLGGPPYTTGALHRPGHQHHPNQHQPQMTSSSMPTAPVPARHRAGSASTTTADLLLFDGLVPGQELHPVLAPFSASSSAPLVAPTTQQPSTMAGFLPPLQPTSPSSPAAVGSPSSSFHAGGGGVMPLTMAAPVTSSSSSPVSSSSSSSGGYVFPAAPQNLLYHHHQQHQQPYVGQAGPPAYYPPSSFPSVPPFHQQQQQPLYPQQPQYHHQPQQQQPQLQAPLQPFKPLQPTMQAGGGLYHPQQQQQFGGHGQQGFQGPLQPQPQWHHPQQPAPGPGGAGPRQFA